MTLLLLSLACGGDSGKSANDSASAADTALTTGSDPSGTGTTAADGTYTFTSREGGDSSVAYTGQILRHLLIVDLKGRIDGLTARIDGGYFPEPGDIEQELNFYVDYDGSVGGSVPFDYTLSLPAQQSTYGEVGDANLRDKLAGNDPEGQHVDWNTVGIVGWPGSPTPEALVRAWIAEVDAAAVQRSLGTAPSAPDGSPLPSVAVSAEGRDHGQLLQKFLLGAIAFSQGADDYLDDDLPGKGLLADHSALEEGKPYTALEHQWDEGFGYFGAARDYAGRTAAAVAEDPAADSYRVDGQIDLLSEVCWGHSANAAKRDNDAPVSAELMERSFQAFLAGRTLLAETSGPLTEDQLTTLRGHRDAAVRAWEEAIAATVIHYINDTLADYAAIGTPEHSFADQAKHWSELKGFALSFQFNPRSALSDSDFAQLHTWLGDAPVSPNASPSEVEAAAADLRAARDLCFSTWGFDAANAGDEDGANGW